MYTPWVAQYMLNDVLHNPGQYTKAYSIFALPSRVLENGGVSECCEVESFMNTNV